MAEPTDEWPNSDCGEGPVRHFAEVVPWCRKEQKFHRSEKGLRALMGLRDKSGWVLAPAPKVFCTCNDNGTIRLNSFSAL